MKKHQILFKKIKKILVNHFGDEINEFENGQHLTIGKSGIWISLDASELTIGCGINHRHYNLEYDKTNTLIEVFCDLLTNKKRTTKYFKGTYQFKSKIELESKTGDYIELSTSSTWFFPFWKKTKKEVSIEEKIIERSLIENDFLELLKSIRIED